MKSKSEDIRQIFKKGTAIDKAIAKAVAEARQRNAQIAKATTSRTSGQLRASSKRIKPS
jgi:hypothetical protein